MTSDNNFEEDQSPQDLRKSVQGVTSMYSDKNQGSVIGRRKKWAPAAAHKEESAEQAKENFQQPKPEIATKSNTRRNFLDLCTTPTGEHSAEKSDSNMFKPNRQYSQQDKQFSIFTDPNEQLKRKQRQQQADKMQMMDDLLMAEESSDEQHQQQATYSHQSVPQQHEQPQQDENVIDLIESMLNQ